MFVWCVLNCIVCVCVCVRVSVFVTVDVLIGCLKEYFKNTVIIYLLTHSFAVIETQIENFRNFRNKNFSRSDSYNT